MNSNDTECCVECGGYEALDTCICEDFPDPEAKQICHFCGVDLFLTRTDLNIRMCVPCGLALNHEECCKCVVCNHAWLVDEDRSVCEFCMSL